MRVFPYMTRKVMSVTPGTKLSQARQIMIEEGIRHLMVVKDDQLVGLISDRDILAEGRMEFGALRCPEKDVESVMSVDLYTCRPSASVASAAKVMTDHKVDCLPVTQFGRLIGLLTSTNLMCILVHEDQMVAV